MMAYLGLLAGVIYSFGGALIDLGVFSFAETPGLSYGTVLAFMALVGMPLLFEIVGYVTGLLGAATYNIASRWFGTANTSLH